MKIKFIKSLIFNSFAILAILVSCKNEQPVEEEIIPGIIVENMDNLSIFPLYSFDIVVY